MDTNPMNQPYDLGEENTYSASTSVFEEALEAKRRFSLEEDIDQKAKLLEEREMKLKTARIQINGEIKELESWAQELEEREVALEKQEEDRNGFLVQVEKWESDREMILGEFRRVEEELTAREHDMEDRKKRLDSVEERLSQAMEVAEDVNHKSSGLQNLQKKLEAKEAKVSTLSTQLEEREKDIERRRLEIRKKEEKVEEYMHAIQFQEDEINDLRDKLGQMEKEHSVLVDRFGRVKSRAQAAEEIEQALREAEEERDRLKKMMKEEQGGGKEVVDSLVKKVRSLESEVVKRRQENKQRIDDLVRLERAVRERDERLKQVRTSDRTETKPLSRAPLRRADKLEKKAEQGTIDAPAPDPTRVPREAEIWFQKGRALMKKGNFRPAVLCFDQALDRAEGNAELLLHKARALYAANSHVQAAKILDYLARISDDPEIYELNGLNLYKLHHETDALEAFERAIELEKRPSSLKLASKLLQKKGEGDRALNYLEESLRIDPDDKQAWKMKSSILTDLERHKEAGEALRNSMGRSG